MNKLSFYFHIHTHANDLRVRELIEIDTCIAIGTYRYINTN
jgi:hypothetical protein